MGLRKARSDEALLLGLKARRLPRSIHSVSSVAKLPAADSAVYVDMLHWLAGAVWVLDKGRKVGQQIDMHRGEVDVGGAIEPVLQMAYHANFPVFRLPNGNVGSEIMRGLGDVRLPTRGVVGLGAKAAESSDESHHDTGGN
jgi:hypothetical protein